MISTNSTRGVALNEETHRRRTVLCHLVIPEAGAAASSTFIADRVFGYLVADDGADWFSEWSARSGILVILEDGSRFRIGVIQANGNFMATRDTQAVA